MSYDVDLMYEENIAKVPPHSEGGTYSPGNTDASLNITYNYHMFFEEHLGDRGIYSLQGKRADQTICQLEKAVDALGSFAPDEDYWKPTAGNAKKALLILLEWAKLHPTAIWDVS